MEDTDYSVPENAGMVEICAILLEGALERTANVTLSTIDGSAIGNQSKVQWTTAILVLDSVMWICLYLNHSSS